MWIFSSPEPKAHRWAYSIGRHPSSVRRPSSVNIFKRHLLWNLQGSLLPNFIYSIYRQGEPIILFFIQIASELWLLWQLKVSIDLYGKIWKFAFIAMSLQIFWQNFYRNVPWVVLYQPHEIYKIAQFGWLPWQPKWLKIEKIFKKSSPQKLCNQ